MDLLAQRIVLLDGAMGTQIQLLKLSEALYRGTRFKDLKQSVQGNNELLNLTCPNLIEDIHEEFLQSGVDILETNTFGATRIAQQDYGLADLAYEMNVAGAQLACRARAPLKTRTPSFCFWGFGPHPQNRQHQPRCGRSGRSKCRL